MPDGLDVDMMEEEETTDNEDSESESQTGTETETETGSEMSQHGQKGEYFGNRNSKGERQGRGRSVLSNGDIYLGCYYRGQRHGLGVYRYKKGKGARYGGDWNYGEKNGWGTFYFPDGSQYTGSWYKGLKHGWGTYVYANGDEYQGWWFYGEKHNRGIYRTKSTGEKFVGYWLLGDRHGEGMIIRKNHKYIGDWYKDVPMGDGIFIFPELEIEQHGTYIHFKVSPGQEDKWIDEGHQIRTIRADEPPQNPYALERNLAQGGGGEVTVLNDADSVKSNASPMDEDEVFQEMKAFVEKEIAKGQNNRIPIIPMWRNTRVTPLMTKLLDEDVPPPSMPSTPRPPSEDDDDLDDDAKSEQGSQGQGQGESELDDGQSLAEATTTDEQPPEESDDDLTNSRRQAQSHHMNDPYIGSGVSQEDDLGYKGLEGEVYDRFSEMSLSNVPEFEEKVREKVEKIMSGPFSNAAEGDMENNESLSDRWRYTLNKNGKKCLVAPKTRIPAPPVVQQNEPDDDADSSMNPSVKPSASQMSSKSNNSDSAEQKSMKSQSKSSSKSSIGQSSSKSKASSKSSQSKMDEEESKNDGDEESGDIGNEEEDDGNQGMLRLEEESLDESQYVGSEYYDEHGGSKAGNISGQKKQSQNDESESSTGADEESVLVINPSNASNVVKDKDNVPIALEEKMDDFKDVDEEE